MAHARTRKSYGGEKVFDVVVIILVALIAILFMLPLLNVLASSFSDPKAVVTGKVGLFPVDFSLVGYETIFKADSIWRGFLNSIIYTVVGTVITVTCQMLCAYPLSRKDFKGRKVINIILTLTMFISGGMIPTYLIINEIGLYNSVWAIILPGCISVFNIVVIRTYMSSAINNELQEAAMIDGCGDWKTFVYVILPLSRPIIFVMVLYAVVGYWNSYFNAMMYVKDETLYPLQNVLNNILIGTGSSSLGGGDPNLSEQLKYVTIVVSSIPLLVVYPFFEKYFEKGVTIGGIKG